MRRVPHRFACPRRIGSVPAPVRAGPRGFGYRLETGPGVDRLSVGDASSVRSSCRAGTVRCARPAAMSSASGSSPTTASTARSTTARPASTTGRRPVWMYSMGGLSELAVMPERAAARLRDDLPLADAAILGCALLTAYGAAHGVGNLQPGETVAVLGAGGIGTSLVQMASPWAPSGSLPSTSPPRSSTLPGHWAPPTSSTARAMTPSKRSASSPQGEAPTSSLRRSGSQRPSARRPRWRPTEAAA